MDRLFWFTAQSTVVALLLAFVVSGLTHRWRNPPVAHVLWLLVLLKLVAPPLVTIKLAVPRLIKAIPGSVLMIEDQPRIEAQKVERPQRYPDSTSDRTTARSMAIGMPAGASASTIRFHGNLVLRVLLGVWCAGAGIYALVAVRRIVRFARFLREMLPASDRVQRLVARVAGRYGLRTLPVVLYAECIEIPLLWYAGRRPAIVLPMNMIRNLDDQSVVFIVAHELAHLRRGDHWVRLVELLVSSVWWWNPLVWVILRQIHKAEEMCCDGWVRWAFPQDASRYAEVLLRTAESLTTNAPGARARLASVPASPFLRPFSLKERIEMILQSRFAPSVSPRGLLAISLVAVALVVLPSFLPATLANAQARSNQEGQAAAAPVATHEFPFAVKFQQGATRFSTDDKITILEVRGTAETFAPGNIYWIKGAYKLASHDRAMLAAYTTAREAKNGTGPSLKAQMTTVDRGDGTFTLFLPVSYEGWPHVSFYPSDGGESFGGNYFGTGEFVLKHWWGD